MRGTSSRADREVLRALAGEVAEIAALPVQRESISRWKALNGSRPVRPMVLIDEIPWHEGDVDGTLESQAEDDDARAFEQELRQTLYRWRHLRADMVVEPVIDVPMIIRSDGFGVDVDERTLATDLHNEILSHEYHDQLPDEEAVEREIRRVVEVCEQAGCPLEITMKDISTVGGRLQRLWAWAEMVMDVVNG